MTDHLEKMQLSLHSLAAAIATDEPLGLIGEALWKRLDSPALRELIARKRAEIASDGPTP